MKKFNIFQSPKDSFALLLTLIGLLLIIWLELNAGIAMLIGLAIGMVFEPSFGTFSHRWSPNILKSAVVFIGFGIEMSLIKTTASSSLFLIVAIVAIAFSLGFLLSRLFGVEKKLGTLISAGSAICGGSAIAAASQAMNAPKQAITISLTVIFLLNLLGLYAFPAIGTWLNLTQQEFGMWAALAIHDTSSVVGAAAIYGEEALEIATSTKLIRALWIIPLVLVMTMVYREGKAGFSIPVFILLFFAASTSRMLLDAEALFATLYEVGKVGLVIALFALGLSINRQSFSQMSLKPLLMAVLLWVFISVISLFAITYWY